MTHSQISNDDDMPRILSAEKKEEIKFYYKKKNFIWYAITWSLYLFQILIAINAIYNVYSDRYDWYQYWSIICSMLGTLFAITYIDSNYNRDEFDD